MTAAAAIRELIAAYALALDASEVEECVQLFTADGKFLVYGRSFDGHSATARTRVLFVRAADPHQRLALYDDEFVRQGAEGARWRFQRRRCQFVTSGGLSDSPDAP